MSDESFNVDALIDELIEREGAYVNHAADKGGPTCFGLTEAVARAHGYAGAMRSLPRHQAAAIYHRLYWLPPRYDQVAKRTERVAAELFDTGVNIGPAVATTFLQRALTALNRNGKDYADLTPDGRVGPLTLHALDAYLATRGKRPGETVLMRALEALQGELTFASPNADPPMRRSFTARSRTVSAQPASTKRTRRRQCEHL